MRIIGNDPSNTRQTQRVASGALTNGATVVVNSDGTVSAIDGTNTGGAIIDTKGAIADNQTGLTAGQSYFVQTDGTLGTTADDPSVFAGTAVSATKLIVKG